MTRRNSNKKKYSKKYNKKRNTIKNGKKTQRGGAIETIDLIKKEYVTTVLVDFDGLKLKCTLGKNQLIIGMDINLYCVLVKYNIESRSCELSSFFLRKEKSTCIVDRDIDNSEFKKNPAIDLSSYNKIFNEKILEFIDAINSYLGILYCSLMDISSLKNLDVCGDLKLYVLKQFERGYSFYNEFGYMYNPKESYYNPEDPYHDYEEIITTYNPKNPYHDYEEIITTANEYLDTLKKINSEMTVETLSESFEKKKDLYIRKPEFNSINLIFKEYNGKTISFLIKDIMNYCRSPLSKNGKKILYKYNELYGYKIVVAFIRTIEDIFYEISTVYHFTKLYKYPEVLRSPILVSTLVDKESDEKRRFEMQPMKNYKLELKKNEGEETFTLTITTI
jgi:hypothetical protein